MSGARCGLYATALSAPVACQSRALQAGKVGSQGESKDLFILFDAYVNKRVGRMLKGMKRKVGLIVFVLIAAYFIVYFAIMYSYPILSESATQVNELRVVCSNGQTGLSEQPVIIDDAEAINDFTTIITSGQKGVIRHPSHMESLQCDFDAEVKVIYSSGNSDELQLRKNQLYKMLNTKGNSGDPGFAWITDDRIEEFFRSYIR